MALEVSTFRTMQESLMAKYRVVALTAVVLLFAALFASLLMAAEMHGVMMKDGKMMMTDGRATGPMKHEMTIKLGYKMVKYLTEVNFLPERTGGYWEDQGYEWFGGV
jgi:DMSO/TMAO reductase YedYZ molybdopterin-dependent catalytic subunit